MGFVVAKTIYVVIYLAKIFLVLIVTIFLVPGLGPGVNIAEGLRQERPYFDDVSPRNVTTVVGQVAVLRCRAKHIGNRTVSDLRERYI